MVWHGNRGFCPTCGTILFNHVSEGAHDEHWAMHTDCIVNSQPPKSEKEIFMKSKPDWVPCCGGSEKFTGMPGA
jgi:hypothetical protein